MSSRRGVPVCDLRRLAKLTGIPSPSTLKKDELASLLDTCLFKIVTVNVGVYMLGDVMLRESDQKSLPTDVRDYIASIRDKSKIVTSPDDPKVRYLNISYSAIVQEMLCRHILSVMVDSNADVICTQEDVLAQDSSGKMTPIFEELYASMGYNLVSFCESHLSFSPVLNGIYGQGKVKLGNAIYVRDTVYDHIDYVGNLGNLDETASETCSAAPRCGAFINIRGKTIYNVHLCGGRYDDTSALSGNADFAGLKVSEAKTLAKVRADIICGDFNSALIPGSYDYSYPKFLKQGFSDQDKETWKVWQSGSLLYLLDNGYNSTYDNIHDTVPTTYCGNTTVDWIFYRAASGLEFVSNVIIPLYKPGDHSISDHQAVMATFHRW